MKPREVRETARLKHQDLSEQRRFSHQSNYVGLHECTHMRLEFGGTSVQVFFDYRDNATMPMPQDFLDKIREYADR